MSEPVNQGSPQGVKYSRSMRNYLLQPVLQLKIGLYCATLGICFLVGTGTYLYLRFSQLTDVIVQLTGANDHVKSLLENYFVSVARTTAILAVAYILLTLSISVFFTHKMVGPAIAMRRFIRQLQEGRYAARLSLRKGDAFKEVAQDLNELAAALQEKTKTRENRSA